MGCSSGTPADRQSPKCLCCHGHERRRRLRQSEGRHPGQIRITSETYRRRFRSLHIQPNETPRELYVRLKELFTRWIQPEKTTIQKMSEKLILEQFLRMVTPELEVWIKEHDPDTAEEAARLAEVFMSARRGPDLPTLAANLASPCQVSPLGVMGVVQSRVETAAGNDIPTLPDLIVQADVAHPERVVEPVVEPLVQCTPESAKPCNVLTRAQIARGVFEELPFCDEELETQPCKTKKPKAQKRREKFVGSQKGKEELPKPLSPLEVCIPSDIGALQKEDVTLKPWFDKVKEQEGIKTGKGVKGIRTTPYHPQTDGLVERYNQTLKSMLRKFVSTTGRDWDQWLPYLLFAYREVPQASTGFSPFELLYGRQVRGPLDLLKDHWERTEPEGDNVVAYVLKMRERLQAMAAMAQENLKAAQTSQKTWYDQKAKNRTFKPGQKVLLLLPTSENKLLAKWHGPYEITKQVSNVTYELFMPERLKKHQVFHINLLKEFIVRQEPSQQFLVRAVKDEEVSEKFFPIPAAEPAAIDLSHLSPPQQDELKPLLNADLFQETPGFTSLVQHQIRLKQDAPKRQRSYRIPERLVPVLKKEIELMLELGIIEISDSEWCSPVVLVPKKDGSLRFCIDFRYLNAISNFDPYPMPRIDELLERVGSAAYITTLDLSRGYWQLALAPEARELTAFKTPFGLFQFRVMPFGLQGAPATFQRLMDHVLRDVSQFSAAYLDDVVIYSRSWKEHLHHLQEVLKRIQAAGLTINPRKCAVAHREVEYLGYTIGFGKIKPQVQKMEAIRSFPVPTTKKKVRGFIGLVGWYRKFIPQFADRSAILNDLTKNSAPNKVRWTEACNRAFNDLKESICTRPVLQSPDFDLPFILQTDASGVGLGAVLLQEKDGDRRPVVFLSRRLLDRETRYSAVEKECLAMKWAIDSLRYYLLGRHFILETDHRALQWLHRMREANTRIAGWYLALQPYNFTVHYKPGKTNIVADCLSRIDEE
ncbi:hypothetical protein WMY93_011657 [Mugilogobius chulae]|uniref:ribonuclease H n=1 Tax=Mugilogobius chulae TaxID=88201 RepID=A0AAW0P6F9_9GOBI